MAKRRDLISRIFQTLDFAGTYPDAQGDRTKTLAMFQGDMMRYTSELAEVPGVIRAFGEVNVTDVKGGQLWVVGEIGIEKSHLSSDLNRAILDLLADGFMYRAATGTYVIEGVF